MRIVLRIVAVAIWIAVIWTIGAVWRFWHFDHFASLIATGFLGVITIVGWGIDLIVGGFAATQLWRLRESGRISSIFLVGYGALYYVTGWLSIAVKSGKAGHFPWVVIAMNVAVAILLLSPHARRACQPEASLIHT